MTPLFQLSPVTAIVFTMLMVRARSRDWYTDSDDSALALSTSIPFWTRTADLDSDLEPTQPHSGLSAHVSLSGQPSGQAIRGPDGSPALLSLHVRGAWGGSDGIHSEHKTMPHVR